MRFTNKVIALVFNVAVLPSASAVAAPATTAPVPTPLPSQAVQQQVPATAPASPSGQLQLAYTQGDGVLSAGLALGGINGSAGSMSIPPIFGGFDYGIAPDISVGAMAAYYQASASYGYGVDRKYSYTTVAGRGDYHFGRFVPVEKLDLYGGLLLGYSIVSVSSSSSTFGGSAGSSASSNLLVWGANVGARYFFSKALAAQVELGVGLGNLSLGLAYKL